MLTIAMVILIPFLAAALIPFINKKVPTINIGWFVLTIPLMLFIGLTRYIPRLLMAKHTYKQLSGFHPLELISRPIPWAKYDFRSSYHWGWNTCYSLFNLLFI